MNEKDTFLAIHQREYQTTRRLIGAFPAKGLSLRPHERSRSAQELAFTLAQQEKFFLQALKGVFDPSIFAAAPPSTLPEILQALDANSSQVQREISAAGEAEVNKTMNFAGHEMRRMDALWGI